MLVHSILLCLALNVYYESRGEPEAGQLAVAHVTLNRVREDETNVCREVFRPKQFSWTRKFFRIPTQNDEAWQKAKSIAARSLVDKDNTNNAIFFHTLRCKNASVIKKAGVMTKQIGHHTFYARKD